MKKVLFSLICIPLLHIGCSDNNDIIVEDKEIRIETLNADNQDFNNLSPSQFEVNSTKPWIANLSGDVDAFIISSLSGSAGKSSIIVTPREKNYTEVDKKIIISLSPSKTKSTNTANSNSDTEIKFIQKSYTAFKMMEIHMTTPGTINNHLKNITDSELGAIRVYGNMNSSDIQNLGIAIKAKNRTHTVDLSNAKLENKTITNHTFSGCTSLVAIFVPKDLEKVDIFAFKGCIQLEHFGGKFIGDLKVIGNSAFQGCKSLKGGLLFSSSVKSIGGYAFQDCGLNGELKFADVNSELELIGAYAFDGNQLTGSLTIPDGVIQITPGAFRNNKFSESLVLGKNTINVIGSAFEGSIFSNIYIPSLTPPSGEPFLDNQKGATLYVPKESVERYKTAHVWKGFSNYVGN